MDDNLNMSLFDSSGALEVPEGVDLTTDDQTEEVIDQNDNTENDIDTVENTDQNDNISEDANPGVVANEDAQDNGEGVENTSPNFYSSVAAVLHEQGLLPSLDLENAKIESIDDFVEAFNAEKEKVIQQELAKKLGEEGAEAVNSGIKVDEYQEYQNQIKSLEQITDDLLKEDLELSKRVIYQDLINQGLSENKAKTILERSISLGDDTIIEDALDSIKNVKSFTQNKFNEIKESRKKQIELDKQKEIETEKKIKDSIYNKEEIIKGKQLSKKVKDQVYNTMTKIVGTNPETGQPENELMKTRREQGVDFDAKLYYLFTLTKGFTDFSKILEDSKSTAVNELEKAFNSRKITNDSTPSYLQDGESYDGIVGELVI